MTISAVVDRLYTVKLGDSLSKIAQSFYGDASQYRLIADRNNLNPSALLMVGTRLILPAREELQEVQITAQRVPETTAPTAEIGPEVVNVTASVWWKDWRYWAGIGAGVALVWYLAARRKS